jgi:hypothetical protein
MMAQHTATLSTTLRTLAEALQVTLALAPSSQGQETAQREITTALENALDARRQRAVESGCVLVGSNSARVLRRLGVATPISTGLIVHKQLKGAHQLKGAYHVSLRHSFNRRHYRHGTC